MLLYLYLISLSFFYRLFLLFHFHHMLLYLYLTSPSFFRRLFLFPTRLRIIRYNKKNVFISHIISKSFLSHIINPLPSIRCTRQWSRGPVPQSPLRCIIISIIGAFTKSRRVALTCRTCRHRKPLDTMINGPMTQDMNLAYRTHWQVSVLGSLKVSEKLEGFWMSVSTC